MKLTRYMFIWSTYILAAPAGIAFIAAMMVYNTLDCALRDGFWYSPIKTLGAFWEGAKLGHRFNMHWAKTGKADYSILM